MAAVNTQLLTLSFDNSRIAVLNATYVPTAGKQYVKAQIASMVSKALTMGADRSSGIGASGYTSQWDGVLQVDAVWPENAGDDGCYAMQQKLLRLFFRGLTLVTSDGLNVHFDTPTALPIRPDPGGWVRGPVKCPFWWLENT